MNGLKVESLVILKSDPSQRGKVLQVRKNGKVVLVKFEQQIRPTLHSVEGLVVISVSSQLPLFGPS